MRHEAAALLVGDLLHDRLPADCRLSVIAHVVSCDDCRDLVNTYLTISEGLRGAEAEDTSHPSSESIVAHALGSGPARGDDALWIAGHLDHCNSCSMEVESVREAERSLAFLERRAQPGFA